MNEVETYQYEVETLGYFPVNLHKEIQFAEKGLEISHRIALTFPPLTNALKVHRIQSGSGEAMQAVSTLQGRRRAARAGAATRWPRGACAKAADFIRAPPLRSLRSGAKSRGQFAGPP